MGCDETTDVPQLPKATEYIGSSLKLEFALINFWVFKSQQGIESFFIKCVETKVRFGESVNNCHASARSMK